MVEYLKWDSDFFGYKIGKINVTKSISFSSISEAIKKQTDYKLIYLVIDEPFHFPKLQQELEEKRIKLVDSKVTFTQKIASENNNDDSFENIQLYLPTVANQKLIDLSLQSGIYSRFQTDKNFVDNEYKKLYTTWIQNSVNGEIADRVIVAYKESEIIGLLTLAFKNGFSDIGILAVDSKYRGQKTGQKLIQKAIHETSQQLINQIKVVTQKDNTKACNFYKNQNFNIEKLEYIYHIWL
jgi:dTDP-4-amino-4,6-dideoxy-D-galactose acyltransferase